MPKITFKSYNGNPWEYDIIARTIRPSDPSAPKTPYKAKDGKFFTDMLGVDRAYFDDQVLNHAEILILNVTDRCNMRCKYCAFSGAYHGQRTHGCETMTLDVAMRAIDQLVARGSKTLADPEKQLAVNFYGGEPLLAFDLIKEILHQVHHVKYPQLSQKIKHSITTNGTLLDEEKLKVFAQYNVGLRVSVDGPKEIHDKNRVFSDGSGSFDVIIRNLQAMQQKFPDYFQHVGYIATMFAPLRHAERADFFDGHQLFRGHPMLNTSVVDTNNSLEFDRSETEADIRGFDAMCHRLHQKAAVNDTAGAAFESGMFSRALASLRSMQVEQKACGCGLCQGDHIRPNGCCIPGQRRALLSTDGMYYLCDKVAQSAHFQLGDVESGVSTDQAWKLYSDYIALSREDCISCPIGGICNYCPAVALEGEYMGINSKRMQCAPQLPFTKRLFELYASIMEDTDPDALDMWIAPRFV